MLTPLGDTNQVLICQSTLPSHLLMSFSMVSCSTDSRKCQLVNGKAFYLLSSLVHNVFNFANFFDWVNEKLYKDQFHIFSFYKQQMGLISISGLNISNLSLFCFIIDHNVRMIEYADQKDEGKNDGLGGMNYVSYSFLSSNLNLHKFYDPIDLWMEEVYNNQSHPWHDFISLYPYLSLIFKQQVAMALIFIHITYNLSLTCCIINCKEIQIDPFNEWLHWIYDFT